jgi:hypothetical protein
MSGLTTSWVLLLLLQIPTIYCQGGGHNHTVYATHHDIDEVRRDIDEVRRECERKIEALDTEWKIKQVNWHHSVLSLIQQLYSTTSENIYNDLLQDLGTAFNPATSCKDLKLLQPNRASGWYVIRNMFGQVSYQYCNMDLV